MKRKILSITLVFFIFVLLGCTRNEEKEISKENKDIIEKVVVEKKEKCPIAKAQEEYDYFWNHYNKPKKLISSVDYYSIWDICYSEKYFLVRKKHEGKLIAYIYDYEYNLIETIEPKDNLKFHNLDQPLEMLMCTDGEENNSIMLINFNHAYEVVKTKEKRSLQIHKKIIGDNSEPKPYFEIPCEENEYISTFRWTKKGLFLVKETNIYDQENSKKILYLLDNSKNLVKIMEYDNNTYVSDMKDDWLLMRREIREYTGNDKVIRHKHNSEIFKYNFKTKEKIHLPVLSYLSSVRGESLYEGEISFSNLSYKFFNSSENFLAVETLTDNTHFWTDNRTLILGSEFVLHSFNGVFQGYIKDGFIYTVRLNKEDWRDWTVDLYVVKKITLINKKVKIN